MRPDTRVADSFEVFIWHRRYAQNSRYVLVSQTRSRPKPPVANLFNQPLGVSPRLAREPDANAYRLMNATVKFLCLC